MTLQPPKPRQIVTVPGKVDACTILPQPFAGGRRRGVLSGVGQRSGGLSGVGRRLGGLSAAAGGGGIPQGSIDRSARIDKSIGDPLGLDRLERLESIGHPLGDIP